MVSIQRRFNSTGRMRIPRSHIEVALQEPLDPGGFPVAFATFNFDGLNLPPSANMVLEAYFRSSSMRFPCGTVESLAVPSSMELSEIDRGGAVRFRLLVIDAGYTGRIIAAADGLRPMRDRNSPERQSLLPLRETDLGDQLWKIDVDYRTGPTLLLNGTIPGLESKLREQPLLQGLVLPHALRMILLELGRGQADDEDDIWRKDWRTFLDAFDIPIEPDDPDDPESVDEWVEHAVGVFCTQKSFARHVKLDGVFLCVGAISDSGGPIVQGPL
jgi:hypothetical protein